MPQAILIFDGYCNFCNGFVDFVIKRDPLKNIHFTASQEKTGKKLLKQFKVKKYESLILVEGDHYSEKSTATLRLLKYLRFPWPLFYVFIIVPTFIRDAIYDIIGKHRYQWFGKRTTCRVPSKEEQSRFLK